MALLTFRVPPSPKQRENDMRTIKDILTGFLVIGSLLIILAGVAMVTEPVGSVYITQYEE